MRYFSILIFVLNALPGSAQQLFTTTNVQSAYKNHTRTTSGEPGKNYWQNRGDYNIRIKFDPATNILTGEETITYYNNCFILVYFIPLGIIPISIK